MFWIIVSAWVACAMLVLLFNLPPGIRHMLRLRKENPDATRKDVVEMWVFFVAITAAMVVVFAPLTAAGILAKGGETTGLEEE